MAYLKTKTVNGIDYYYASESHNQEVVDVYYFGNRQPTNSEWQAVVKALEEKDVFKPKQAELEPSKITRLDELNKKMKKELKEMSSSEKEKFDEKFENDYIYNTNSIEGSTLNSEQTYFVTHHKQGVEGKSLKELHMARNLMSAVEYLRAYSGNVDSSLAKKLHEMVQESIQPKDELGHYKKRQNYIIGADFLPTPPNLVESRMDGLFRWYGINKDKYHPFELAAICHLKLVGIHPFVDGNGRAARLMHNYILKKYEFEPIIFRVSTKQKYYFALRQAQTYGGHKPFIDYCIEEFVSTYESPIEGAEKSP